MCSALYCVILIRIPSACLAARWYEDAHPMRITQSISLSNIQTLSIYREGPPLGGGKPAEFTACPLIGVAHKEAAIRKQ
jgi:hypothetical protein